MADCKICENNCCPYAKTSRSGLVACSGYKAPPKTKTNADRIRAMSDEELAVWLVKKTTYQESAWSEPSYLNFLTGSEDTIESAIKDTMKWLKQPAEQGGQ